MSAKSAMTSKSPLVIVACGVMEAQLEKIRAGKPDLEIRYLDQGLHRTPKELAPLLQRQIDAVSADAAEIVIGYGLCSNGIVGLKSMKQTLIIPRCHDCISLFLGSPGAYRQAFKESPGTFYLTPSWVADRHDPLGVVEDLYTPRVGYDTAVWAMQEELKHYTRFTLILAGESVADSIRDRALENAAFFDKEFQEIPGSLDYFKKLVEGPYTEEDFLFVPAGEQVTQEMFLKTASSPPVRAAAGSSHGA